MLCNSLEQNCGVLIRDNTIKYDPARPVLKLKIGETICITRADFERLFRAYFAEIEAKFSQR
jgi:hypothetical protein